MTMIQFKQNRFVIGKITVSDVSGIALLREGTLLFQSEGNVFHEVRQDGFRYSAKIKPGMDFYGSGKKKILSEGGETEYSDVSHFETLSYPEYSITIRNPTWMNESAEYHHVYDSTGSRHSIRLSDGAYSLWKA